MSVAVIVPTFGRGKSVYASLRHVLACSPPPDEIIVHIDRSDGTLEQDIAREFQSVKVISSKERIGPGGGRHRCLSACSSDYAVSLDDDSWPVDADFFAKVSGIFQTLPEAAVLAASIRHRGEPEIPRDARLVPAPNFVGCGHAIRIASYRAVRGYLPRPVAYGLEESDLSLQLWEAGWKIFQSGELRVFHDTDRQHHNAPEITSGQITNLGLCVFLNYPVSAWGLGLLQLTNAVRDAVRRGRYRGILTGLLRIPIDCVRHANYRRPIRSSVLRTYRNLLAATDGRSAN